MSHHSITAEALASKERFERNAATRLIEYETALAQNSKEQLEFGAFFTATKDEVSRLTEAEAMLFGATNAGIASSFNNEVKTLDKRIQNATTMFVIGIIALLVSLAPLVLYMTSIAVGHEMTLGSVFARGLLLIPAGWFSLHFVKRIHANFELRQQYVHKYTLASTVEPFRRQSAENGAAVVADVWDELRKNPASIMRRHRKMGDGPGEAVQDIVQPVTKLLSGPSERTSD